MPIYLNLQFGVSSDKNQASDLHTDMLTWSGFVTMATMHAFCRDDFTRFADFCFRTYGDRVKNWFTINEPRMMASHGYGDGYFPPARCTGCHFGGNSATEPYIAGHNLLLAHASAVKLYREKYQACDLPGSR